MESYRDSESSSSYEHHHHDHHHFHHKCQQNLYQFVQVETRDASVYQGILHSYDNDKLYLLMPTTAQPRNDLDPDQTRQFFPFFGPFGLFGFPFYGIGRFGPFSPFWW
ncbi:hypothetical protein [Pseudalkalibacillus caeni]|uniref:Uncharacterized protein n=1 Tax=Exobacillus caeni TaxID=2574798 RepID=A0A5R9FBG9_9BACL|nr:hypothetical protein [Pseudalkalibacillus caeni]TLS36965.1 hypothetical protein FCL54_13505 [Pseudalkalibacillus caeni]